MSEFSWMLLSGVVCFVIAVFLGGYRQFCSYIEVKHGAWDSPWVWRSVLFRTFSWLIVAAASIWAACSAAMIGYAIVRSFLSDIFANGVLCAVIGAILLLRFSLSALVGSKVFYGKI